MIKKLLCSTLFVLACGSAQAQAPMSAGTAGSAPDASPPKPERLQPVQATIPGIEGSGGDDSTSLRAKRSRAILPQPGSAADYGPRLAQPVISQ